ncbi:MAG: hypothetical protein P8Z78_13890 [Gammaproteobacteria bacterium]
MLPETVGEVRVSLQLGNIGQAGMTATRKATMQPQVGAQLARIVEDLQAIGVSEATLLLEQVDLEAEVRDSDGNLVEEPEGTANVKGQAPLPGKQKYTRLGERVILTIG